MASISPVIKDPETRFRWLAPVLAVLCVAALAVLIYWNTIGSRAPITNVEAQWLGIQGERNTAWIEITGRRQRSCPGVIQAWVVNGRVVELPSAVLTEGADPPRRNNGVDKANGSRTDFWFWYSFSLPPNFRDHARVQMRVVWYCNPLHRYFPIAKVIGDVPVTPTRDNVP